MAKRPQQIPTTVRREVADRDEGRCRFCGSPVAVQAHHIRYRSQGGEHIESNLISLCLEHHALVHSDKRRWMPLLNLTLEFGRRGMSLTVPQVERWMGREARDGKEADL